MTTDQTQLPHSGSWPSDDVEAALRELSTWSGPDEMPGELARRAMAESVAAPESARPFRMVPRSRWSLAVAALLTISAGSVLSLAVVEFRRLNSDVTDASPKAAMAWDLDSKPDRRLLSRVPELPSQAPVNGVGGGGEMAALEGVPGKRAIAGEWSDRQAIEIPASSGLVQSDLASDRQVIRTASIGITVHELSQSFVQAQGLVRTIDGEFVETSQLSAVERSATLTLRVAAARLPEVLQGLRALGEVTAEAAQGSDVTDQLVDLVARIRNERRIEGELLDLLSARKGAPLDELMRVRGQLDLVRQGIERLEAQRERATRQVNFSAISVTLRLPAEVEKPAPPQESNSLSYTTSTIANAWQASLRAATDGIAFLITVLIGGLPWWCILTAATFGLRSLWLRRVASGLA